MKQSCDTVLQLMLAVACSELTLVLLLNVLAVASEQDCVSKK